MPGKPITVGTDGSAESLRDVEWAAREAALRSLPLRIVSIPALPSRTSRFQPPGRPDAVAESAHESYTAALARAADRARELEPGLAIHTELLSGPPAEALAEAADDASMLVVGSRGGGMMAPMVLDSVSRYAATHSRCPVVVRRREANSAHREIVVGVGDLDQSAAALGFAFEEAALRGAGLTVVHAWSSYLPAPGPGDQRAGAERAAANSCHLSPGMPAQLQDMVAGWQEKYPAVEAGAEIMHAHPAHLLAAASDAADLVVLGRRPGGTDGSRMSSVIHGVLHRAHGPVAIVAG
jgi:nucleotide-binding universal stress UspA family protein